MNHLISFGPSEFEKIKALKEFAEANIITEAEALAAQQGEVKKFADREGWRTLLNNGLGVVYTIVEYPHGAMRQLTVQCKTDVPGVTRSAAPNVYEIVMTLLGFRHGLDTVMKDIDTHCIMVCEFVREEDEKVFYAERKG